MKKWLNRCGKPYEHVTVAYNKDLDGLDVFMFYKTGAASFKNDLARSKFSTKAMERFDFCIDCYGLTEKSKNLCPSNYIFNIENKA